jgi:hypothetical protein
MNAASLLFSEAGLAIPRPEQEVLVPEDFIYTSGLREEFAIAAYYAADPEQKKRGHAVCDELAIDRAVPTGSRNLARSNLLFYTEPANAMMPSFAAQPVSLSVPCGYRPGNPSVACWGEEVVVAQSLVPIGTCPPRNFLLRLGDRLEIRSKIEISMPEIPVTEWRPFAWRGGLWYCAAERTTTMARIDDRETGHWRFADWRSLPCADGRNWLPVVGGEGLRLVAIGDPIRIMVERSEMISEVKPAFAAEHFTGSSQIIALDGGWLAVVCDIIKQSPDTQVECRHRFVWLDETWAMRAVSRAFFFRRKGAEFAAGLAWHPDERRLLVSWGDGEPWIATIEAADIRKALIVQ